MQLQSFYGLCCILLQTIFKTALSGPVTENSIVNSNSIFSSRFPVNLHNHQNHHHHQFGVDKPSKLRLYLLADLARAAETKSYLNCESSVDLKVNTRNCTCSNFACHRYYKTVKKPRIFERTCEDVCCGKLRLKGKSLSDEENDKKVVVRSAATASAPVTMEADSENAAQAQAHAISCGEIIPDKNDKLTIPWIVQISSEGQDRCIGSLLSSRAVITSLNCIDKTNKITVTRFNNLTMPADHLPVKEIIQDDLVEKSVILVLGEPVPTVEKNMNPCLPQDGHKLSNSPNCYLGLPNRVAAPVKLLPHDDCDKITATSQTSTNNICVQYHYLSEEHTGPGAPLICNWDARYPHNFQIVGILSEKFNDVLVFDDINRIENMIRLNLNTLM
ncbi:unnamed protein product [Hermetia illucens]|uniref:Peptidase S1 domain-containing protein n=2 Tax=Hermetia illucens TaxID=343691 RepID=A0A7R8UWW4_HERIL|nr:unnamed protein product [Hermetia illucens]